MDIFEQASRKKLRFPSERGDLTTEQLWDLELTSKTGFNLDTIARQVNSDLKSIVEGSFVVQSIDPRKNTLELQLEILKHVIAAKLQRIADAKASAERAALRQKLTTALAAKEDEKLSGMSVEEIQAELAKLANG